MSIISRSVAVALTALVVLAGAASAASADGPITRWCVHEGDGRVIEGTVSLTSGRAGEQVVVLLYGLRVDPAQPPVLIQSFGPITLRPGSGAYDFRFANVEPASFGAYQIVADLGGAQVAESIDIEAECIPPGVPETPSPILLIGSGLGVAALFLALQSRRGPLRA